MAPIVAVADRVKVPPQVDENPIVMPTENTAGGPGLQSTDVVQFASVCIGGMTALPEAFPNVTAPVLGMLVALKIK